MEKVREDNIDKELAFDTVSSKKKIPKKKKNWGLSRKTQKVTLMENGSNGQASWRRGWRCR